MQTLEQKEHPISLERLWEAGLPMPLVLESLCAGFPSPADDYLDDNIDLTRVLMPNRPATFLWRVGGHSMIEAGIYDGDLLVVDRSLKPQHNDIVVAVVNGERSLKRLNLRGARPNLVCENKNFPEFLVPDGAEIEIWGVVRCNIHMLAQR